MNGEKVIGHSRKIITSASPQRIKNVYCRFKRIFCCFFIKTDMRIAYDTEAVYDVHYRKGQWFFLRIGEVTLKHA